MTERTRRLAEFTTSGRWWDGLWGGGHTLETDPTKRGWRAALSRKGSEVLVIGRKGVPGCFSAIQLSGNKLDVATYDDLTPEELAKALEDDRVPADAYEQVEAIPGWVLPFIQEIEG